MFSGWYSTLTQRRYLQHDISSSPPGQSGLLSHVFVLLIHFGEFLHLYSLVPHENSVVGATTSVTCIRYHFASYHAPNATTIVIKYYFLK